MGVLDKAGAKRTETHYYKGRSKGRWYVFDCLDACGNEIRIKGSRVFLSTGYCRGCTRRHQRPRTRKPRIKIVREPGSLKICSHCGIKKPIEDFTKDKHNRDGLDIRCKPCKSIAQSDSRREYRKNNKYKARAYNQSAAVQQRTKEARQKNHERELLNGAKHRSKVQGVPFTIQEKDIIIPTHCPIFGIRLQRNYLYGGMDSPTLDKIVPELGYVPGNIEVISKRANLMKYDGTAEEHRRIAQYIDSKTSPKSEI